MACVAVTVALTSGAVAVAVQISAVPSFLLTRLTSVHSRPAPETVRVCLDAPFGPSDDTNATRTSPASDVLNGAVTRVPVPSENVNTSTPSGSGGPDETTRSTAAPTVADAPPIGDWLITEPASTEVLDAVVTVPTASFASVIAAIASACVISITFGTTTSTCGTPVETTIAIALPLATDAPAAGD